MAKNWQLTNSILMIRPVAFRRNEQTAVNNYYQKLLAGISPEEIQAKVMAEFDGMVEKLRRAGVHVIVVNDTADPDTPDSIFPNNWVSFHHDGRVGLFPMFAENRRLERREDILETLVDEYGFHIEELADFTELEEQEAFLEGTGSMVLDRKNHIAYAALSERTDEHALMLFCEEFDYIPVTFSAFQTVNGERLPIYHTNVMMSVGDKIAAICADCIDDEDERKKVLNRLKSTQKELVLLTEEQIGRFAGNMLEVLGDKGEHIMVMSTAAYGALSEEQIDTIKKHCTIVHSDLTVIEALGGGSARCMMCEVFLPKEYHNEN